MRVGLNGVHNAMTAANTKNAAEANQATRGCVSAVELYIPPNISGERIAHALSISAMAEST